MQKPKAIELVLTCSDLFPKWLEYLKNDPEISQQTHLRYESTVKVYLLKYFGKYKIKELSDESLLKFTVFLKELKLGKKSLAAKTIKNIIGSLSNFFEYCCLRDYIKLNPAKSPLFRQNLIRFVKERRKSDQNIKEKSRNFEELNKLLIASYERDYDFGLTVEFMLASGLRLGEVAALTWGDIRSSTNNTGRTAWFISVNKTRFFMDKQVQTSAKSGSNGFVPLPNILIERFEYWKKQSIKLGYSVLPESVIFPRVAQNQMGFSRMIARTSKQIGIRKTTAHCLRHSYVTFLATNGHNLQQVQKAARHSSVKMTTAYFSASQLGLDEIANTMEKFLVPTANLGQVIGTSPKLS